MPCSILWMSASKFAKFICQHSPIYLPDHKLKWFYAANLVHKQLWLDLSIKQLQYVNCKGKGFSEKYRYSKPPHSTCQWYCKHEHWQWSSTHADVSYQTSNRNSHPYHTTQPSLWQIMLLFTIQCLKHWCILKAIVHSELLQNLHYILKIPALLQILKYLPQNLC